MTPKELCEYIIDGNVFDECPSGESSYAELGRYTWPGRYAHLVMLAKLALQSLNCTCSKCSGFDVEQYYKD
jgi:hypothetical protein